MKIEHLKKFNSFYDKYGKKLVIGSLGIAAISAFGAGLYKLGFKDGAYKAYADCLRYLNDIADDDGLVDIGDIVMKKK